MYNASSRPVLGPPSIPKMESGPDVCPRSSWLPQHMHLPLRKIIFRFITKDTDNGISSPKNSDIDITNGTNNYLRSYQQFV